MYNQIRKKVNYASPDSPLPPYAFNWGKNHVYRCYNLNSTSTESETRIYFYIEEFGIIPGIPSMEF